MWRAFVLALFVALSGCSERPPAPFASTDISGAAFGKSLSGLRNHHGEPVALADFRGKAVLLFFGYTACPDVCPTTLSRFAEVMKRLGKDSQRVQVLFVTLDPERDSAEKLAAYVPWFDPSFIGLYGDAAATAAVAGDFKVYFARSKASSGMDYVIDHSAGAYAFDPAGRLRLYVKDDVAVDALVGDLKRLLDGD